jgi:hypothetical protein
VETELKYGKDLRIIVDEFYHPMLGTKETMNKKALYEYTRSLRKLFITAPLAGGP